MSGGSNYFPIGIKTVNWGPEGVTAGTPYYTQIEQLDYLTGGTSQQRMEVRKTERGLYYYLDTTGFSALILILQNRLFKLTGITAISLRFADNLGRLLGLML
ncbi:MAG: hypothetical protein IPG53_18945 [Ignavibacteriales bacterium]|nr:hypothetical protein [Ignavibacteriales bacterium]